MGITDDEKREMLELLMIMDRNRQEFIKKYDVPHAERIIEMVVDGVMIECRIGDVNK